MVFGRKRRATGSIVMDEAGIRRLVGDQITEQIDWDRLLSVDIVTTADGPANEDVFFLLGGADGLGVAVPSGAAPPGFVERLQQLKGFDNEVLIRAMGSTADARFHCWPPAEEAPLPGS
jgi:hypothetical protein